MRAASGEPRGQAIGLAAAAASDSAASHLQETRCIRLVAIEGMLAPSWPSPPALASHAQTPRDKLPVLETSPNGRKRGLAGCKWSWKQLACDPGAASGNRWIRRPVTRACTRKVSPTASRWPANCFRVSSAPTERAGSIAVLGRYRSATSYVASNGDPTRPSQMQTADAFNVPLQTCSTTTFTSLIPGNRY